MTMHATPMDIPDVLLIEPRVFSDQRGFFLETYQQRKYAEAGLEYSFVQDNHSRSQKSVLRGLHYQLENPQGKLVYAVRGEIFDVAVDIRRGSPSFGRWTGTFLSDTNHRQIFIPEGFAHGFAVLSEFADVVYKCTRFYAPGDEYGIYWGDEQIGIQWPLQAPLLSEKDQRYPRLHETPEGRLPVYRAHPG
ncbi:MAG: dTDP-4-dehydrorhamnose 3,5-epimerase [Desulfosalsimonadaceae bacterium]